MSFLISVVFLFAQRNIQVGNSSPFNIVSDIQHLVSAVVYNTPRPPTTLIGYETESITYKGENLVFPQYQAGLRKVIGNLVNLVADSIVEAFNRVEPSYAPPPWYNPLPDGPLAPSSLAAEPTGHNADMNVEDEPEDDDIPLFVDPRHPEAAPAGSHQVASVVGNQAAYAPVPVGYTQMQMRRLLGNPQAEFKSDLQQLAVDVLP
ncbi:hypothetical protein B0H10DRAFT_2221286 [Mycena sp. CBHHK59/15]|nr:hypothetical protein B0H10DRAFT_2221286 [Mycena sp. CBHHK59/15]